MSFKSEAANVRAGIASGSYKKKKDPFEGFFNELASGIRKRDEEKRQEERVKRQEARAEARRVKVKQDAEDKLEQERESLANFYLNSNQQSPTAENRASVMNIIKGGKFTSYSDLDEHMKTYTTYNAGTPQADIDAQMEQVGLLQEGDGPFRAKTDEVNSLSPDGTIEFTGKKPDLYDTGKLRENNWEGELQREISANGENSPNALAIRAWAVGQKFFTVAGGYTQQELMALPITGDGTTVGLDTILNTTSLTEAELKIVTDIQTVKKAEEQDANIMNDMDKLILKPINDLQAYVAVYKEDTKFGKNAREALSIKQAIDASDNLLQSSRQLDKDVSWYDAAIASVGVLDQADTNYTQNVKSLENLILLRGLAVEKVNADDLEAEMKLSTKERFLRAKYREEGFFIIDPKTNTYKIPDSGSMASIETTWKKLTDITDKPDAFSKDKLLNMDVGDLKTIIDTGMLSDRPDELALVNSMYESRVGQADATKLSKDLDPTQQNFTSTTALDAHLAGLGSDKMTSEAFANFVAVRSVLAKAEGKIADEKDIDVYQMALREHLELPDNKGLNGQEFIDMVANWETTWKDSSAKTSTETFDTNFVAGKINEAKTLLRSDNPEDVAKGKAFMDNELPDMMSALTSVSGTALQQGAKKQFLLDAGVDEDVANALVSGTAQVTTDAVTGERSLTNFDSFGVTAPADIQPAVQKIGLDIQSLMQNGFTTTINGEEVTFTAQQLAESAEFMKNEEKAGGNLDVQKAFGSGAFLKWFGAEVGGLVGLAPFKELTEMQTHIEGLNNAAMRTISVAIAGSRDSVFNKDAINKTLPQPSTLLENKTEAKGKLIGTVNQLKKIIDAQNATFNGRTTPEAKSKAFIQLQALDPLYKSYSRLLAAWEAGEKASKPKVRSGLQLTDTVTTGSEIEVQEPVVGSSLTQTGTQDGIKVYSFGDN